VALKDYADICVVQSDLERGCIPAGIEWILRYLKIPGVNFKGFQERHNLELQGTGRNNFYTVRTHVEHEVPDIRFIDRPFASGQDKIEFVKGLIEKSTPCLISIPNPLTGRYHIVPVVEIDDENMIVLWMNEGTVEEQKKNVRLDTIKQIHDENLQSQNGVDILFPEIGEGSLSYLTQHPRDF